MYLAQSFFSLNLKTFSQIYFPMHYQYTYHSPLLILYNLQDDKAFSL